MANDIALLDLALPYVLLGKSLGTLHSALSVLYVQDHQTYTDSSGVVIRGTARFNTDVLPFFDPGSGKLGVVLDGVGEHPQNDSSRRAPWIDTQDARIDFQLLAPRQASPTIAKGIPTDAGFAPAAAVLSALDNDPTANRASSDYPSTAFTLDLLLTSVVLRPPFLRGASPTADGLLVDDPANEEVKFTLPRIKLRLSQQDSPTGSQLQANLMSAGDLGLDDPGDLDVAELITMDPPYAFARTALPGSTSKPHEIDLVF